MGTAQARERQLIRETLIALAAIALAAGCLCAVVGWKYGVLGAPSVASPPAIASLAELPEYAQSQRAKAEAERIAAAAAMHKRQTRRVEPPAVVHAAQESAWTPLHSMVDYQTPVKPESGGSWPPAGSPEAPPEVGPHPDSTLSAPNPATTTIDPPRLAAPEPFEPRRFAEAVEPPPEIRDAPPAGREVTDPAGARVTFTSRRLVAPFVEDALPPTDETEPEPAAGDDSPPTAAGASPPTEVVVAPGDSFFRIAQRVYGSGEFYKALYEHNRRRFPRAGSLPVGAMVATPPAAELQRLYPALGPPM